MKTLTFSVVENERQVHLETQLNEYRNLMSLIKDKMYLDDFGVCGGLGRCATCIVEVRRLDGLSSIVEEKEYHTLKKFNKQDTCSRLSCQISITEDLQGAIFELESI